MGGTFPPGASEHTEASPAGPARRAADTAPTVNRDLTKRKTEGARSPGRTCYDCYGERATLFMELERMIYGLNYVPPQIHRLMP